MIISAPFRNSNPRLAVIGVIIGLGLFILLADLWRVQVLNAEHYGGRDQAQSLRRIRIPSARGEIIDRNGVVLANNRPSYDIAFYLDQLGQVSKTQDIVRIAEANLVALSQALNMPVTLADRDVRIHYQRRRPLPLPVWRNLRPEMVAAFEERASNLPGADLIVTPVRQYPLGSLAAHVLGYIGKSYTNDDESVERFYYYEPDSIGIQGVECTCDEFLRGAPGGYTIRVNPAGRKVGDVGRKPAEVGDRVTLTLDARIQKTVEDALERAPLSAGKELRGAAVVLDLRNGEILAMASAPAFDPNIFNPGVSAATVNAVMNDPRSPMLNRAIGARYAPGSTFKVVTLLAGLEAGSIAPRDSIVCNGAIQIGTWPRPFRCWNTRGHAAVDALSAIKESCDIYFYEKGLATGVDAITRMAGELGLGQPTGIDVGSDLGGLVPTPAWKRVQRGERWWDGDTAQLAIGQSFLLATPLQMACMAAALGNRGTLWRPFVIKRIETDSGQVVRQTNPEVRNRLHESPQNIEFVCQAMLAAVRDVDGTAHQAAVKGLSVAGKTGTSEFQVREGRIKRAWFIGFAPSNDPQVAVAVLIEDANSGGHTAAPVAGAILAGIFQKKTEDTGRTAQELYAD
jgi:penicillin-binding protein 2